MSDHPATTTPTKKRSHRSSEPKVFRCTGFGNCDMVFTRSEHLARHARKHTGEKPFKCVVPGCNRMFSRFDNMVQHTATHDKHMNRKRGAQQQGGNAPEHAPKRVKKTPTAMTPPPQQQQQLHQAHSYPYQEERILHLASTKPLNHQKLPPLQFPVSPAHHPPSAAAAEELDYFHHHTAPFLPSPKELGLAMPMDRMASPPFDNASISSRDSSTAASPSSWSASPPASHATAFLPVPPLSHHYSTTSRRLSQADLSMPIQALATNDIMEHAAQLDDVQLTNDEYMALQAMSQLRSPTSATTWHRNTPNHIMAQESSSRFA